MKIRCGPVWGLLVVLVGCSATPRPIREFPNPPGCEGIVAHYRANPTLAVDSLPKAGVITIPKTAEPQNAVQMALREPNAEPFPGRSVVMVSIVILETGLVDPETVVVEGDLGGTGKWVYEDASEDWTFTPARAGQCWVPRAARVDYKWGRDGPTPWRS